MSTATTAFLSRRLFNFTVCNGDLPRGTEICVLLILFFFFAQWCCHRRHKYLCLHNEDKAHGLLLVRYSCIRQILSLLTEGAPDVLIGVTTSSVTPSRLVVTNALTSRHAGYLLCDIFQLISRCFPDNLHFAP